MYTVPTTVELLPSAGQGRGRGGVQRDVLQYLGGGPVGGHISTNSSLHHYAGSATSRFGPAAAVNAGNSRGEGGGRAGPSERGWARRAAHHTADSQAGRDGDGGAARRLYDRGELLAVHLRGCAGLR